jgi:hypothetical protein
MQNAPCAVIAAIPRQSQRATLRRLFGEVQWLRTVNRYGFVSGQRCGLEAAPGLSRQRVSIWVDEGDLHIEYKEPLRAWYRWHRCVRVVEVFVG